jgi:hypothetical protein
MLVKGTVPSSNRSEGNFLSTWYLVMVVSKSVLLALVGK